MYLTGNITIDLLMTAIGSVTIVTAIFAGCIAHRKGLKHGRKS